MGHGLICEADIIVCDNDFLRLFIAHEKALKAFLLAATADLHVAEDLFQEIAIIAWRKFAEYDARRRFGAWLFGIARLEVLQWRRRQARDRLVLSDEMVSLLADEAGHEIDVREERIRRLGECMQRLTRFQRVIVRLRYEEGLSIKGIVDRLDRTAGSVQMVLSRARAVLRECVQRHGSDHHNERL